MMHSVPGAIVGAAWALATAVSMSSAAIESAPVSQRWAVALYISLTIVGLFASMAFSGLETATYAMSRLRLLVRMSRGEAIALRLQHEISNRRRLLSTLLIGNNMANFLMSFGVTAILTRVIGLGNWSSIIIQAVVLTPLLFVFGETLPKEYGRSHANHLVYRAAGLLRIFRLICTGIGLLPLVYWLGEASLALMVSRQGRQGASARARIVSLFEEGVGSGLLTEQQSSLIERALAMRQMTVMDELIPWAMVVTVQQSATPLQLRRTASRYNYTRYPVLDDSGQVVGVTTLLQMLTADPGRTPAQADGAGPRRLEYAPAVFVDVKLPIQQALAVMRQAGVTLAIVTGSASSGKPLGIVTTKDLVEPLIGDIAAG